MGKTMEVYIDDMLVQSKERPDHMKHLQETFELLCTNGMKLNPLKCAFRVSSGKFLGFMVTQRGIEANPIQLRAIMESQTPSSRKMSVVTDWLVGGFGAIHLSFYRPIEVVLYHSKRVQTDRLEYRMQPGLHGNQVVSHRTPNSS